MFFHKAVRAQLRSLRGEAEAISVLKTRFPQIYFRASSAEEETNGPQKTGKENKASPRRT